MKSEVEIRLQMKALLTLSDYQHKLMQAVFWLIL